MKNIYIYEIYFSGNQEFQFGKIYIEINIRFWKKNEKLIVYYLDISNQ